MTTRLQILESSLDKKNAAVAAKVQNHFDDVRSANGQPLNDKRNGYATMSRWGRQNDGIRSAIHSVEVTESAIEREKAAIARVENAEIHPVLVDMVQSGELIQWRKFPNIFFVPGVDRGRIVWDEEKKILAHRYLKEVPKEQYGTFRDAVNKANRLIRETN